MPDLGSPVLSRALFSDLCRQQCSLAYIMDRSLLLILLFLFGMTLVAGNGLQRTSRSRSRGP